MTDKKAANKADKNAATKVVEDRGESPFSMEPMLPSEGGPKYDEITDLVVELTSCSDAAISARAHSKP